MMATDPHVNGVGPTPRTLEERLALAQAEGLEANLRRQLRFIGARGVVELQVVGVRRNAQDSYEKVKAAHATSSSSAVALSNDADAWHAQGQYIISARLKAGVESRRGPDAWHELGKGSSTTDNDVAARRILPIDLDVARPANISATDAEMALSVSVALKVHQYLVPIVGEGSLALVHSGNGRQIHIALDDIAESSDVKLIVCSILAGVDSLFSTSEVKVDLKMADAKRLLPACGTLKKKGAPGIADRPHRRTAIVTSADPRNVTLDGLWELHSRIRSDCDQAGRAAMDRAKGIKPKPGQAKSSSPPTSGSSPFEEANAVDSTSVAEWLDLYDSGNLRCPGCGESDGVDIIDHGLKCLHNRCEGRGRSGFRTNVDITMEVRGVDARAAVNLLAARFGFEPLRDRQAANENDGTPYSEYKANEPKPSAFRIWTPAEIWAPIEDPDFLMEGLCVRGALAIIVAYGSSLKTWLLADAAMAIATGGKWLHRFETKQGKALLIDFESGDWELRRRVHRIALGRDLHTPIEGFAFCSMPELSLADDAFYTELEALAREFQFVGIDSLAAGSGGIDENDARFARSLQRLKKIAATTGCVIVLLHHSRKGTPGEGTGDQREMVRGSSAIFNAVDVCLQLARSKEDVFICHQTKARGGKTGEPFVVRVEDTGPKASRVVASDVGTGAEDDDSVPLTGPMEKATRAILILLGTEHDLRSKNEVCARVRGTRAVKLQALQELLDRHLVAVSEGAFRLASEVRK